MPVIPSVDNFIFQGLSTKATFFGCDDVDKITIIYLPNAEYTFDSGPSTAKLQYSEEETGETIANGGQVAEQGGKQGWAVCLACGLLKKSSGNALPGDCEACFQEYCFSAS